jgi:hypothetical protein
LAEGARMATECLCDVPSFFAEPETPQSSAD